MEKNITGFVRLDAHAESTVMGSEKKGNRLRFVRSPGERSCAYASAIGD